MLFLIFQEDCSSDDVEFLFFLLSLCIEDIKLFIFLIVFDLD